MLNVGEHSVREGTATGKKLARVSLKIQVVRGVGVIRDRKVGGWVSNVRSVLKKGGEVS